MFIGHFAVGFAAKKATPRTSLGMLILAALFLDALWPVLLLAGGEHATLVPSTNPFLMLRFDDYPISHSLVMAIVWSVALGGLYHAVTKNGRGAVWVGVLVFSHWVLDWIVHVPDLPIAPTDSPKVGLGLWRSPVATMVVEGAMFVAGVGIYAAITRARGPVGRFGFWAYVLVIAALYVLNAKSTSPPPSMRAVAIIGLAGWLFVLWAWWFDGDREVRAAPA